ncbi:MAG TPA: M23 family metallopeptidase [Candidatus Babeliales bacterium]|nr:M23 family metallopeptidase [Candidatus Babeliales bacterium]
MISLRHIPKVFLLIITVWIGWQLYGYFLDATYPSVIINGINEDCYYSGDIRCIVQSDKTGDLSLSLNNHVLVSNTRIKAGQQGHSFIISSKTVNNGQHILNAEFTDTTFKQNKVTLQRNFYIDNSPLQAVLIKTGSPYKVFQGRTLHIQLQVNKDVKQVFINTLSRTFECFPEAKHSKIYECFIPIECEEQPNEYLFSVVIEDKIGNKLHLDSKFQVVVYPFKKEVITVTANKVREEKSLGKDGKNLEDEINQLSLQSPKVKLWRGTFCTPIDIQRITCDYGTIRTTQHKGRYAHKAIDVINMPRSVVWAPQDGIVVMKDRFAPSGNTIIIDHGLGILSLFYHLEDFADIEVGQKITQGNPIGTIGKTGFATGYHLHWEMRINNIPVDPLQWTKMFL